MPEHVEMGSAGYQGKGGKPLIRTKGTNCVSGQKAPTGYQGNGYQLSIKANGPTGYAGKGLTCYHDKRYRLSIRENGTT